MTADEALGVHLVGEVVRTDGAAAGPTSIIERVVAAPRELLMRTKAKASARAGYSPDTPTLDL